VLKKYDRLKRRDVDSNFYFPFRSQETRSNVEESKQRRDALINFWAQLHLAWRDRSFLLA
jgi:hypothetical protein